MHVNAFPRIGRESQMLCLAVSGHEEFRIFVLWGEEESMQCEGNRMITFIRA